MYDDFRLDMIRELVAEGVDDITMKRVIGMLDKVGSDYDMERKCTALIPIEDTAQHQLLEYLACRSLEGLSKQTLERYHFTLAPFLQAMAKPIDQISTNDIRAYLYKYQQERGVTNRTLDHMRMVISGLFHWAVAEGKIERDPSLAIHSIKYIAPPKPSLSQIELEYVRRVLGTRREKAMIEMLYSTGCRVSELCGMKQADVDWDAATVQIFGKGGKYRTAFLNAKAMVALRDYLDEREDGSEYLFVSERQPHGQLKRAAVEKIVRQISERAYNRTGVRITPHVFRHTMISTALRNGMPIERVSRAAGHANIKTTMDYAKINTEDVQHDHQRYVI